MEKNDKFAIYEYEKCMESLRLSFAAFLHDTIYIPAHIIKYCRLLILTHMDTNCIEWEGKKRSVIDSPGMEMALYTKQKKKPRTSDENFRLQEMKFHSIFEKFCQILEANCYNFSYRSL